MDRAVNEETAAEMKRPRRCIQSKLPWHVSRGEEGEEEREESGESEGESKGKRKRKTKAQPRAPRKSPISSKEARGLGKGNKNSVVSVNSEFCAKVLERNPHEEQQDELALIVGDHKSCKPLDSRSSKKRCRKLKKKGEVATPSKDPSSSESDPKTPKSKKRLFDCNATIDIEDAQCLHTDPLVFDLWLEAKIAAEENLRLSAGKQTHPFFTRRKAPKRVSHTVDISKLESSRWSVLDEDEIISCAPVHVFEIPRDTAVSLDWKNWTFSERGLHDLNGYCAIKSSPVFEGSVEPLRFDNVCRKEIYSDRVLDKAKTTSAISTTIASILTHGQETKEQLFPYLKAHVDGNFSLCNLENGQHDRLPKERLSSYYLRCSYSTECSLWTNKYQPENALEVCGNLESISLLSEWLKSWHERSPQTSKNGKSRDRCTTDDSEDSFYEDESDMEDVDGATLKNVLLITGPVGIGKSAAIYACAKEQGFEVIEVNASDLRNGVHVKQKFGEAMESHGFNRWSSEDHIVTRKNHILEFTSAPRVSREVDFESASFDVTSTCNHAVISREFSGNGTDSRVAACQAANKTLILFEDVDIIFDEDRGFIAAILQLAETAKRPMILTCNSINPALPQLLDRLVLNFTLPSSGELLSHVYMICVAEKACVSPQLVEQFINSCQCDIRKTLMLLQFWCQGNRSEVDLNMQCTYSPLPFDLDAAHLIMPRILPWAFPCELSKKVEEEINKTSSMLEENIMFMESMKEQDLKVKEIVDSSKMGSNVAKTIKAKKDVMLKRNGYIHDCTEVSAHVNELDDSSDASDSPVTYARRTCKHRPGTVLSSQSEDELFTDDLPSTDNMSEDPNSYLLPDVSKVPIFPTQEVLDDLILPDDSIHQSRGDETVRNPIICSETASLSHICETLNLQDVSCVPESSFDSVAEISKRKGFLSMEASSNHVSVSLDTSIRSTSVLLGAEVNNLARTIGKSHKLSDSKVGNRCEFDVESVYGNEELGNSQNEDSEPLCRGYQLMDECSRADFSMRLLQEENCILPEEVDSMQETWRKLRSLREGLRSYLTTDQEVASQTVKLASALTDLISETDIMLSGCSSHVSDVLEPSTISCVEPDSFSWYDAQFEMGSTFAQHGLCFYTNKCATIGSNLSCEHKVDLAQAMLLSSTNTVALGKLLAQGNTACQNSYVGGLQIEAPKYGISEGRELESGLYNTILPIVPVRLSMAVKGCALHEYFSFMSRISKLECYRLSESVNGMKQRRSRVSRHYLSSGPNSLSPEDVELLAQNSCFGDGVRFSRKVMGRW